MKNVLDILNVIATTTLERVKGVSRDGEVYFDCYLAETPDKYYDIQVIDMYAVEEFGPVMVMVLDL